ncbi:Glu-tRNA(Gln) amidotransferase subunit GatE [Marine Group I thaumarchaeote]|jgi:glutamyl-tRNA(Gln) amidotransferase subunit E|uniref:Glutamyl-tRNA(Gln) amidotransferase subunit E n=1 Tax=Marine Group I thaumarchaeote TaxID=2511932 RepID=A0A7K4NX25_9ARCH|nr:MAG: Glu-tRNA(Gln) amidotransferase GatDE subunit E [Nitrosopumilus sp. YT1]NMI82468.1 Glu-tRNA(Gln) amidotransferase subunit GatE [Candidatus Nitrosopumilus sp. MTA1]NWJ20501.1 Glu-tRNA(Gln) amidotransferase subunit GatE [Marine Group I thaumarchaeote]NWJ56592.1 Glu-tRNA(Gln) amidotransferase subunit GatE [Marine Group I thaumarchaeote]NWJ83140.1 Glu-tRNA(Gln) amidotransferase subunit GatE [Marine Group I thaumarchaeote]
MSEFSINNVGLKVGLEIHQQLATNKKLFCSCRSIESDEYYMKFQRKLRAVKSELGEYDPAALFEKSKLKTIMYYSNPESSCLVEQDEEPPHNLDKDAKELVLVIASSLNSKIFSEIYPMRKTVIDGSNTTGFQRTMLFSQGGQIDVDGDKIGVQSICLEEDSAKLLGDKGSVREYSLDRLGIPLVEIALDPVEVDPKKIKKIALALGRLLRSTKKVTRGIGSIRQDVNVSVKDGGGVVEVKGVQQLDQLERIVEFEAKRQHGLVKIAEKLKNSDFKGISKDVDIFDITKDWSSCKSEIVQKALKDNSIIKAIKIENFSGMFGYSPYEGIRLGKEIGQLVKFYGIGGVFHSDELPNYGINNDDISIVKNILKIKENDAFLIIAAPSSKIDFAIDSIINRIVEAKKGVPAETRLATQTGETVFLRPRPGASRMYPETDIPPILVTSDELENAEKNIPKSWDESLLELQKKHDLNPQLSEQIFDSRYIELFEKIVERTKVNPTFVASILCSSITKLERNGLNSKLLKNEDIVKSFQLLEVGKITKESIEMIFENIMDAKSQTIEEAMKNASIVAVNESDLEKIIEEIVEKNQEIVKNQKERAVGPLMGIAMRELRGKASGELVNKLLLKNIKKKLASI